MPWFAAERYTEIESSPDSNFSIIIYKMAYLITKSMGLLFLSSTLVKLVLESVFFNLYNFYSVLCVLHRYTGNILN